MKYEAYHTDVQKVIDRLARMNDILESRILEDAMRMFEVMSFQVKAYSEEIANLNEENKNLLAANRDVKLHWEVLKADYDNLVNKVNFDEV